MRHLTELALKYLHRQKFRTVLTFLCITLSVFIFAVFCDAVVILRNICLAEVVGHSGNLQINVTKWIEYAPSKKQALEAIRKHVVVGPYLIQDTKRVMTSFNRNAEGCFYYFDFQVNDNEPERISAIFQTWNESRGDVQMPRYADYLGNNFDMDALDSNTVYVPRKFKKMGISVGDTITMTVTPKYGRVDMDCEVVKQAYAMVLEGAGRSQQENHVAVFSDEYDMELSKKEREEAGLDTEVINSIMGSTLMNYLSMKGQTDQVVIEDLIVGTPMTVTAKVAGFTSNEGYYSGYTYNFVTSADCEFDLTSCVTGPFAAVLNMNRENAYMMPLSRYEELSGGVSIVDGMDFDDAAEQLIMDMGVPKAVIEEKNLLHPVTPWDSPYNTELLTLQFRGMDGIASWFAGDYVVATCVLLGLAFGFWLLMRFVIDNAFEISVAERKAQFAVLRVMGASKRQVAVLVCMEALSYSTVAVPVGVICSRFCRNWVLNLLNFYAIKVPSGGMPVLTVLTVVLALLAIFISAYTSSMWAARTHSPLEATRRTDLKGNQKETIWNKNLFGTKTHAQKQDEKIKKKNRPIGGIKAPKKSKLDRKMKEFLRNYTMRNIRRTRSRFVISVITMSIGVALFSFGLFIGLVMVAEVKDAMKDMGERHDMELNYYTFNPEPEEKVEKILADTTLFAGYTKQYGAQSVEISGKEYLENIAGLLPQDYQDEYNAAKHRQIKKAQKQGVDVSNFELPYYPLFQPETEKQYLEDIAGTDAPTFAELEAMDGMILAYSAYGEIAKQGEAVYMGLADPVVIYEPGYNKLDAPVYVTLTETGETVKICGVLCALNLRWGQDAWMLTASDNLEKLIPKEVTRWQDSNMYGINTRYNITLANRNAYGEAREKLQDLQEELYAYSMHGSHLDTEGFLFGTGFAALASAIVGLALIVLLSVWGVGIFTMLNTINAGVLNRADELMMLRMIGMSKKQVDKTVALEGQIYCGFSTVIGCVLGASACLYVAVEGSVRPWQEMFAFLALAVTLVIVLNLLIARIAAKPGLRALNQRLEAGRMMQ